MYEDKTEYKLYLEYLKYGSEQDRRERDVKEAGGPVQNSGRIRPEGSRAGKRRGQLRWK